jgi:hypothetical protein
MKKFIFVLRLVGVSQLVLGALFLLAPAFFIGWMGLHQTPTDSNYLFGMLAARFIAYGIGMFAIARDPQANRFWINNMIFIQLIDLGVGLFYTVVGTLPLAASGFPMFNAALFSVLLFMWKPKK